ncbi:MAG: 4Fe-4S dicluster domain-containing protein [Candidatus Methanodesulfokora washburnensis]|jgi:Fe-S oxidoreductase
MTEELRKEILRDVSKCSFCGFCEWVCPTLKVMNDRVYGARGRINTIMILLRDGERSRKGIDGIFSCLLCGACSTQCPAGIDIREDIRKFRSYILRGFG